MTDGMLELRNNSWKPEFVCTVLTWVTLFS